jgi:DNA-binding response OmpR family regulator
MEIFPTQPRTVERFESAAAPDRILVADDDQGVRDVVANALRLASYRVGCAHDGEDAWNALSSNGYDLLITDHEMPRLTGLDLLRRVRDRKPDVPVILISGTLPRDDPDLLRLIEPGLALEKPFSLKDLLGAVRRFLAPSRRPAGPIQAA